MKRIFFVLMTLAMLMACSDDDQFSADSRLHLTFSADTISLDTLFSHTASSTYTFWVHNRNTEGLRLQSIRLSRQNQTGFRVNVDGNYLDNILGSVITDVEIRRKDSLLVFVELTASETLSDVPQLVEDHLVFTLENGLQQSVCLRAWAWDAVRWMDGVVTTDTVVESAKPLVIFGSLTVREGVTLTLRNTTLYFHDQAGMEIYGNLVVENCLLRGDRLDRMFSYLPYDRVSGQWGGIRFHESSCCNRLIRTEIRNAGNALTIDSAALDSSQVRLSMTECIVHNAKGYGLEAVNAHMSLRDCQFTNTLGPCVSIVGGMVDLSYCTLGQFYPFSAARGVALRFSNYQGQADIPLLRLYCEGSIVTGYDEDVLTGTVRQLDVAFEYQFVNTLLRTPKVETADSLRFRDVRWETPEDSIQGKQHFKNIDEDNLYYDFHLDSLSTAKGLGCYR